MRRLPSALQVRYGEVREWLGGGRYKKYAAAVRLTNFFRECDSFLTLRPAGKPKVTPGGEVKESSKD